MSPQLAAWESTISKADTNRINLHGLSAVLRVDGAANFGFLGKVLQQEVPKMRRSSSHSLSSGR
ncbi:MAG: hypothetical protein CL912_12480 [Deltaproteobacteria bacterium]|nr:hypothetical protein [Deltaproteobacteria bacterium]